MMRRILNRIIDSRVTTAAIFILVWAATFAAAVYVITMVKISVRVKGD